jgi:hypothetical protein
MRVKAIKKYNDTQLERYVKAGEVLEVADARASVLIAARVAEAVESTTPTTDKKRGGTKKKVVKNG